jgi:hypothetical protein
MTGERAYDKNFSNYSGNAQTASGMIIRIKGRDIVGFSRTCDQVKS